jgi:hypothetical protein
LGNIKNNKTNVKFILESNKQRNLWFFLLVDVNGLLTASTGAKLQIKREETIIAANE